MQRYNEHEASPPLADSSTHSSVTVASSTGGDDTEVYSEILEQSDDAADIVLSEDTSEKTIGLYQYQTGFCNPNH